MNSKIAVKITVILMLMVLVATFTHCMPENTLDIKERGTEYSNYTPPSSVPKSEEQELNETQVTVGVKNHEQILQTMATLTGVDPQTNTNVMKVYTEVALSLPTGNDVKVFSPTHQIAISKLAAQFCYAVVIETPTLRANIWPNFNFGQASGNPMSIERRTDAINGAIDNFWLGMVEGEELIEAQKDLDALMEELTKNEASSTNLTLKAMIGLCTATLSSAHVILL
ncbi:hypothetical protein ACJVC5_15460 [Peredibacter sp. HCB2-198]|uniref:hypothetical protein n=1 Tax=Peredibacter sp. HCB2-198 TaxID=3383025 RepID=UPI0038B5E931